MGTSQWAATLCKFNTKTGSSSSRCAMSLAVDINTAILRTQKDKGQWNNWLQVIMQKHSQLDLSGAAIMKANGDILSKTNNLNVSKSDFQEMVDVLGKGEKDTVFFQGVTYCVRESRENQTVAFNGRTYLIISKTKTLYLLVKCQSRLSSSLAAEWVNRIASALIKRNC